MVVLLGLTGGIASGKSTVSTIFTSLGSKGTIGVVDADKISADVLKPNTSTWKKVVAIFGEEFLKKDKSLDRVKLGKVIFSDKSKRIELNKIVHTAILKEMLLAAVKLYFSGARVIIFDVPLLFETNFYKITSPNVVVYCSESKQIQRLMARSKLSVQDAKNRIKSQMSFKEKRKLADYIINNDGNLKYLEKEVNKLFNKYYPDFWKGHREKIIVITALLSIASILAVNMGF
ncbi:dephospho-CoA kinase [Zophobas morio]|uniref:dephospho-CoA kinase n=1 Tax=Zophobas morio TaxID=2755281 RepID=UPI003083C826